MSAQHITRTTALTAAAPKTIAVAYGDGIGPEIMRATLRVLEAAGAPLNLQEVKIGQAVYESGVTAGITNDSWDIIKGADAFLKAPITTPSGKGYKSLNVTARKTLGLYANVRPCVSYMPYVSALHPKMDIVVVRENEEDTYAGIEHRPTDEVVQCLKLISRQGCEKIIRYAFEYAKTNDRKKVTCMTKDNIMKMTDGLFHSVFDEIAAEYPDIKAEHMIIDIGTARVATRPTDFDVIVTENLYGDILSDVAADVAGSVGLAPSANIGPNIAMFEAVHGSAPDIAGKGIANPSGLLLAGVMMLRHLGMHDIAAKVHNAWLVAIENGIHTADIYRDGISKRRVTTDQFADAVISALGQTPAKFLTVEAGSDKEPMQLNQTKQTPAEEKKMIGVDVFIDWKGTDVNRDPMVLGKRLEEVCGDEFKLEMISNRGVKVYPEGHKETVCTDFWRCRFIRKEGHMDINHHMLTTLFTRLAKKGIDFVKTENLHTYNGKAGYTLGQGQ